MPPATTSSLVLLHANSYPAGTYALLRARWIDAGYRVYAPDMFGHDPRFPVTRNWSTLRQQLLDFLHTTVRESAYLVGHSMGGYLALKVAAQHPRGVKGIVLLDAPILSGWRARLLQAAQLTGLIAHISPGRVALRRRDDWPDATAAMMHFANKPRFAAWDPRVLKDYIHAGLSQQGTRYRLRFRPGIEATIYNTLPHHLPRLLKQHPLQCPVAFIGGTESEEIRMVGMRATRMHVGDQISWISGSHLFPFEQPQTCAAEVLRWLQVFGSASPSKAPPPSI